MQKPKRRAPVERKPVEWRQLCAITRALIEAEPTIDDSEWKAQIKNRLTALELDYPEDLDAIGRAMSGVERALEKQWGPRPVPLPSAPASPRQPRQEDPPWRGRRREDGTFTTVQELMLRLVRNLPR